MGRIPTDHLSGGFQRSELHGPGRSRAAANRGGRRVADTWVEIDDVIVFERVYREVLRAAERKAADIIVIARMAREGSASHSVDR